MLHFATHAHDVPAFSVPPLVVVHGRPIVALILWSKGQTIVKVRDGKRRVDAAAHFFSLSLIFVRYTANTQCTALRKVRNTARLSLHKLVECISPVASNRLRFCRMQSSRTARGSECVWRLPRIRTSLGLTAWLGVVSLDQAPSPFDNRRFSRRINWYHGARSIVRDVVTRHFSPPGHLPPPENNHPLCVQMINHRPVGAIGQ